MQKKYCSIQEAADLMGIKKNTLQVWITKRGKYTPKFIKFAASKGIIPDPCAIIKTKAGKNGWTRCEVEGVKRLADFLAKYNFRKINTV